MSTTISIQAVNNKKQLKAFIHFPWKIYKDDPHWVPPLLMDMKRRFNKKKDPFYEYGDLQPFLAYKDGEVVGRIAAISNSLYNKTQDADTAFFGFFECVNDQEVANKLFQVAENWVKERGFTKINGPANPTINHEYGLLVEGFNDSPRIMMSYNPPYYIDLVKNWGFKKDKGLFAYEINSETIHKNPKFQRIAKIARERSKVSIRKINMKNLKAELKLVKKVYNDAWADNYGFIPMTDAELDALAEDFKPIVIDDLVIFAEIDGETVGFALVVPDYNQIFKEMNGRLFPFNFLKLLLPSYRKKIEWLRIIILGVLPKYQRRGIDAVLYQEVLERALKHGYPKGEASWILEDNLGMTRAAEDVMSGKVYKRYHVYEKEV